MGSLATYRRVFANPALARLFVGEFVSSIGDWLYLVALLVVVYRSGASPLVLGVVGAARIVPYILLSVPAGIAADRYDRRMILIVTDVARGVIMLALTALTLLGGDILLIVALSLLAACFSAFFSPAIGSLIPTLVTDERELGPANAAWSSLDNLAFIIGPAVGAILISLGSIPLAFFLNAISFMVVAAVLWRLPRDASRSRVKAEEETAAEPAPKFREAVRPAIRPLSGLGLINLVDGFVSGGLAVLTVVIAIEVLGAGDAGTGWLNAAIGLGGLIGALVAGPMTLRRRLDVPLAVGGVTLGVGVILVGQSAVLLAAIAAMAVATAGMLVLEVVATTIFQREVPDAIRGRTIGAMDTVTVSAYALGAFLAPVLAAIVGPVIVLLGFGIAMVAATLIGTLVVGRSAAPPLDPGADRFVRLPLFDGLSPASLEQAARHLDRVRVMPGEVVIRQGDPADRFFHILDGSFQVTQAKDPGGVPRFLRTMGPDEVFGEIGLLRSVPRTATVTAAGEGALLALDGQRFLELVGAGPGLTSRLLDMHRGAAARVEAIAEDGGTDG
ncbi:MAG TPA: MFS transporter [Candidatus Limnocylindria bacterium]|nr:MFS transporter [Candidatus Limnocylindria bacterium]